jgi:hypothetical protein
VSSRCLGRKLFQSRGRKYRDISPGATSKLAKELFGLAPGKAERGDYICILYGCSVPVVLRRIGHPDLSPMTTMSSEGASDGSDRKRIGCRISTAAAVQDTINARDSIASSTQELNYIDATRPYPFER